MPLTCSLPSQRPSEEGVTPDHRAVWPLIRPERLASWNRAWIALVKPAAADGLLAASHEQAAQADAGVVGMDRHRLDDRRVHRLAGLRLQQVRNGKDVADQLAAPFGQAARVRAAGKVGWARTGRGSRPR